MTDLLEKRAKQVKVVAFTDFGLCIFELIRTGLRFLGISDSRIFYHFMGQSFIFPTILLIVIFAQGLFAIRLYTGTLDISTDIWSASKKSLWWQRLSYLFIIFLLLELFVILYIFITRIYRILTIFSLLVCIWSIGFKIGGIYIVSKFLKQIHLLPIQNVNTPGTTSLSQVSPEIF